MYLQSIGNECVSTAQALFAGCLTFSDFQKLERGPKVDVVMKTMAVAFAAGILGMVLFPSFITAVVSSASGAFAMAHFTRGSVGSVNKSYVLQQLDDLVKRGQCWVDKKPFSKKSSVKEKKIPVNDSVPVDQNKISTVNYNINNNNDKQKESK